MTLRLKPCERQGSRRRSRKTLAERPWRIHLWKGPSTSNQRHPLTSGSCDRRVSSLHGTLCPLRKALQRMRSSKQRLLDTVVEGPVDSKVPDSK
mmetsp:Transcript_19194/g.45120  ORF Transcript_19194/g.45120 Transcript_19194/m.45120 type:complete len:94 (+) Transcript_19194:240-521(+)